MFYVTRFTLVIFILTWKPHAVTGEEDELARGISPLGLFDPPSCIDVDQVYIPVTRPTLSFRVAGMSLCWNYCSLTRGCDIFTFHYITTNCTLYTSARVAKNPKNSQEWTSRLNLGMAYMDCLGCMGPLSNVLATPGVKIKQGMLPFSDAKCLSVTSTNVDPLNESVAYKLDWNSCNKANLWVLTKINNTRSNVDKVRVTLHGFPDWSLERKFYNDVDQGFQVVYLTRTKNVYHQMMVVNQNLNDCSFSIGGKEGRSSDTWVLYTKFRENAYTDLGKSLFMIKFGRPGPSWRCSLESLSVKNGMVMNDDNVPYFLEGAKVIMRCYDGYQVKGLINYTINQELTCSKEINPKPCVMIKNAEMSGFPQDMSLYVSLIVLLSVILIFCSINQPWSSLCGCKRSRTADNDSVAVTQKREKKYDG